MRRFRPTLQSEMPLTAKTPNWYSERGESHDAETNFLRPAQMQPRNDLQHSGPCFLTVRLWTDLVGVGEVPTAPLRPRRRQCACLMRSWLKSPAQIFGSAGASVSQTHRSSKDHGTYLSIASRESHIKAAPDTDRFRRTRQALLRRRGREHRFVVAFDSLFQPDISAQTPGERPLSCVAGFVSRIPVVARRRSALAIPRREQQSCLAILDSVCH